MSWDELEAGARAAFLTAFTWVYVALLAIALAVTMAVGGCIGYRLSQWLLGGFWL